MKTKFYFLLSFLLAVSTVGSFKAKGQTFWDNGCDCGNSFLTDAPTPPICNYTITINGLRFYDYVAEYSSESNFLSSVSSSYQKPGRPNGASGVCTKPGNTSLTYWVNSAGDVYTTYYSSHWSTTPSFHCGTNNDECCNNGVYYWEEHTVSLNRNVKDGIPPCWHWGTPSHTHNPITVNIKSVQKSLVYQTPKWRHDRWTFHFSASTNTNPYWTEAAGTPTNVNTGNINTTASGVRLTGNSPQITATGSGLNSKNLNFGANRLLFDNPWDVSYNGVSPTWDATTSTGIGTLGFYRNQTTDITKSGGKLALGPCANRSGITINTQDAALTVESYTFEANNGLDCDGTHNTAESYGLGIPNSKITINNNRLNITNSWRGCNAVDFCADQGAFQPTFSGSGVLLIDPNVTNFKAGATLSGNTGDIKIYSKKITSDGNFTYTSGGGSLLIDMRHRVPDCDGCGFFTVNGNFSAENTNGGDVKITDTDTSYVKVTGTYTLTGDTRVKTHLVQVDGSINVGGEATLTGNGESVTFNSEHSSINFGNKLTYIGSEYLKILAQGDCGGTICELGGGYVNIVDAASTTNTGAGTTTIQSDNSYVKMGNGYTHTGETGKMLVTAPNSAVEILGSDLTITRSDDGDDEISGKRVHVENATTYTQSASSTTKGLLIQGDGEPCATYCNYLGGFVWLEDAVVTTNADKGTVRIISTQDSVSMGYGYTHTGVDGDMTIDGHEAVHVYQSNVEITRNNTGAAISLDYIHSADGNIYIEKAFKYTENGATPISNYGLTVLAEGGSCSQYCNDSIKGGYLVIDDEVTVTHAGDGVTLMRSKDDSVAFHNGYVYTGYNGNNTIDGYNGVELTGNNVTINRDPNGSVISGVWDSIYSENGQIHVEKQFDYKLGATNNQAVLGGLLMNAQGLANCNIDFCDVNNKPKNYGGYIWFEDVVNTTADAAAGITPAQDEGTVTIKSDKHFVRMDKEFTHKAQNGDLFVEADGDCDTGCDILLNTNDKKGSSFDFVHGIVSGANAAQDGNDIVFSDGTVTGKTVGVEEGFLADVTRNKSLLTKAYNGRPDAFNASQLSDNRYYGGGGYVWIQDAVTIDYSSNIVVPEGDAKIHSDKDIVQFDKTVDYTDKQGGNLLIEGYAGVRTIDATTIERTKESTVEEAATVYKSENGFVDFFSPFIYTGTNMTPNAYLNFLGHSRVEFNDEVTFDNSTASSRNITAPSVLAAPSAYYRGNNNQDGEVRAYSEAGWVEFLKPLTFKGRDGDLILWAEGRGSNVGGRSCLDSAHVCDDATRAGYVHFNDKVDINYVSAATNDVEGKIWIRSYYDDVKIDQDFKYTNPAADSSGLFVMQAGQDIYGISDGGYGESPETTNAHDANSMITFTQPDKRGILLQAKKTVHLVHDLTYDRTNAADGDITISAGYNSFTDTADVDKINQYLNDGNDWQKVDSTPNDYTSRFPCASTEGGDIWLEGNVDLTKFGTDNKINTTLRAWNSIFIDQQFDYKHTTPESGNAFLFAHTGNIEAIDGSITTTNTPTGQINSKPNNSNTGTTVTFTIDNADNTSEIRLQAGNQPNNANAVSNGYRPVGICEPNESCLNDWETGIGAFDGNILFNKSLSITNKGLGYTLLSASRDIENQVNGPFEFKFENDNITDTIELTAGRHIETHAMVRFTYPTSQSYGDLNGDQIVMQAGRLGAPGNSCTPFLCKANEAGTQLTKLDDATTAYDPTLVSLDTTNQTTIDNEFAANGDGQGSILMFDSVEFNYNGKGRILMTALNGNIESDPYLHRNLNTTTGNVNNNGDGYDAPGNIHDAKLTFNHGGAGITRMEAIDIKLHDKIEYLVTLHHPLDSNGQFYMAAYDSILTRNLNYENKTDSGSVFITTDKYKYVGNNDCGQYACTGDPHGIGQGHIVLGYGADESISDDGANHNDSIIFNFENNNIASQGANVYIRAGYEGFSKNLLKGKANRNLFGNTSPDRGKGYGGNITFDFVNAIMAKGDHTSAGYMEISTPNGNIWGKDSILYHGIYGDLLVDAGLGSIEDADAIRWDSINRSIGDTINAVTDSCARGREKTLNTRVPYVCQNNGEWRTGNIMMKGAYLNFNNYQSPGSGAGTGNATFRTREGYIDMYDAFTVDSMAGHLLFYAAAENGNEGENQWGDVSQRDFEYHQVVNSGSIFYGADDNIMLNYGYSNDDQRATIPVTDGYIYNGRGDYNVATTRSSATTTPLALNDEFKNPYYSTSYIDDNTRRTAGILYRDVYNVNEDGYLWYLNAYTDDNATWTRKLHRMYRGCTDTYGSTCSPLTGQCETTDNKARDLYFNFDVTAGDNQIITSGGLAVVASNYIDMFTKFTFFGGNGSGIASVPGMGTLHGENVQGYGLYVKSQWNGVQPEKRRASCFGCAPDISCRNSNPRGTDYEMTYIGFHDDARIYPQDRNVLLEAPVTEFFGHAELNSYLPATGNPVAPGKGIITIKTDSLIFHDSAIFDQKDQIELVPYTAARGITQGVVNDDELYKLYGTFGRAISMSDRNVPVLELGYQRCFEPDNTATEAPNFNSKAGMEETPEVGGDIIVTHKHGYTFPIFNTVVANHARISFISDSIDNVDGGEYTDTYIKTDLLRIRNKVEFYTDPTQPAYRKGNFKMVSNDQLITVKETGIYPHHLHLEPGSELSVPGEDTMLVVSTTTVGGYGKLHENVFVKANGILAPGYASLMEGDCQTPCRQGDLDIHNLTMEKDAILRISTGLHDVYNSDGELVVDSQLVDCLHVHDSVFFFGKINVRLLLEGNNDNDIRLNEGCYLFMTYDDTAGVSREYVKNFVLERTRYGDYYFGLDYSETGKVYICVATFPIPEVSRYVELPQVNGITTNPIAGRHYVQGHKDFTFTAAFSGTPLKTWAAGYYSGRKVDLDQTAVQQADGSFLYTIRQIVEPWTISFGPETASGVDNEFISGQRVWAYNNTIHINVDKADVVSIYNMTGVLYKKVEIPEGLSKFQIERGVYVVTLKDGSIYKIIVK